MFVARLICVCGIALASPAFALPRGTTTDDCLGHGQCAYADTKGRVTCGLCPGQARALNAPAGATALCVDDSWSEAKTSRGSCSGHGGIKVLLGK
jgi:hypothetical protein